MTLIPRAAALLAASAVVLVSAPVRAVGDIERSLEKTFRVTPGSIVSVGIFGGSITVDEGSSNSVRVSLKQHVHGVNTEREADDLLDDYSVEVAQDGNRISVVVRDKRSTRDHWRRGVSFSAVLSVPPDVRLDLSTSGGSIAVRGDRSAKLDARTSGGSIHVDGGRATMNLVTSGGGITVDQVLTDLDAGTSGGSITVNHVGAEAADVTLSTSGGSIRVGVDRRAKLTLRASTSGGHVSVADLPYESSTTTDRQRTSARGTINGGGGSLRAQTSGGSIEIRGERR